MSHDSVQIANQFVELAKKEGRALTPMQLLKLVYMAHAWMLAIHGRPLIKENVEAWKYGPVILELYQEVKRFRDQPVTHIDCGEFIPDNQALSIIEEVYSKYGELNGMTLSMITHIKGSPWYETWHNGKSVISNDAISYYYQKLINANL